MIKSIAFVTAKPGMSREAFIDRYENGHAPLALRILPPWTFCDYRRNYVKPGTMLTLTEGARPSEPEFHDISEFWYEDETTVERFLRSLAETEVGPQITDDELQFMQRDKIMSLQVEEYSNTSASFAPRPDGSAGRPEVKLFLLARKPPDMFRQDFVRQHDLRQAGLAERVEEAADRRLLADHTWAYPVDGSLFDLPHLQFEAPVPDFDTVVITWFWNKADCELFRALVLNPELSDVVVQGGPALYAPSSVRIFEVDEFVTPRGELLSAGADSPSVFRDG